jgi:hypothetical protein
MSDQDKINLSDRITEGIRKAQRELFERKAKLGESIVIADANGQPVIVKAEDYLKRAGK